MNDTSPAADPPPSVDMPPTPSGGVRKPMPSIELLHRGNEFSNSEMRRMSPEEQRTVINERMKDVETVSSETADAVHAMRGEVHGLKGEIETRFSAFREELLSHITPLKLRVAGLAGLAAVAAAVGGALVTHLVNALIHALR